MCNRMFNFNRGMETKSFKEIVNIKKVVFWAYKFCKQAVTPPINACLRGFFSEKINLDISLYLTARSQILCVTVLRTVGESWVHYELHCWVSTLWIIVWFDCGPRGTTLNLSISLYLGATNWKIWDSLVIWRMNVMLGMLVTHLAPLEQKL